jgi:anti-sigma B factor antagonist/stage II sporulation protein AA (anti-sigma F factor antagonist)
MLSACARKRDAVTVVSDGRALALAGIPPRIVYRSFRGLDNLRAIDRAVWRPVVDWDRDDRADGLVVRPGGRVDETNWQSFAETLAGYVADATGRQRGLVLDLSGLDYMSSRGLRALTLAQRAAREAGVEITLAAPNDRMREILEISRYDKVFRVVESLDAAFAV